MGPAGKLLRRALSELARLDPGAVYITNVVKCRSFEVRGSRKVDVPPTKECVEACSGWLELQMSLVRPRAVIVVGGVASTALLGAPIREIHGTLVEDRTLGRYYLPVLHPSAALRDAATFEAFKSDIRGIGMWLDLHPEIRRKKEQYEPGKGVR